MVVATAVAAALAVAESPYSAAASEAQDLLAHRRFLGRLARSLVGDEHHAEDLVQDTWLRALESAPESGTQRPSSLRGWLGRVLRNRVISTGQREAQRGALEREAVGESAEFGCDDLEAELETQRQVVECLQALREPYRSTLYLRYYRDLGPSAIAEQQELPLKTVKTRLARGLAELRQAMDRRAGGQREAWALMLLPLARSSQGPWAPEGLLQVSLPAAPLTLKLGLGVAAAALAVWGGAARWGSPSTQVSASAPDRVEFLQGRVAVPKTQERSPVPGQRQALPSNGELAKLPAQAPCLSGRLLDYAQQPIAGARLQLRALRTNPLDQARPGGEGAADERVVLGISDAAGEFRLRAPWTGLLGLEVSAAGIAHWNRGVLGTGSDQSLGDLTLDRELELTGRLLDAAGGPLAGAEVWAWRESKPGAPRQESIAWGNRPSCRSNEQGYFRLQGHPVGPWRLHVSAAGHQDTEIQGLLPEASSQAQTLWVGEFSLLAGAAITGRVGRLPAELEVPDSGLELRVQARPMDSGPLGGPGSASLSQRAHVREVLPDAEGRFRFEGLKEQSPYRMSLVASDRGRSATLASLELRAGGPGAVLDWDGAPLEWRGAARERQAGKAPWAQPEAARGVLEVRLTGKDGKPLAGALLALEGVPPGTLEGGEFRVTAWNGSASWKALPAGDLRVRWITAASAFSAVDPRAGSPLGRAAPKASGLRKVTLEAGASLSLDWEVSALGELRGRVLQAGVALPGTWIRLQNEHAQAKEHLYRADSQGRFRAQDLEPGDYRLTLQHAARSSLSRFALRVTAGVQEQTFELSNVSVAGRVLGPAGEPLEGIRVQAQPAAQQEARSAPRFPGVVHSDAQGRFELRGLDPGRVHVLEASGRGFSRTRSAPLQLVPGEARQGVQLVLSAGALLRAELRGAADKSLRPGSGRLRYLLRASTLHPAGEPSHWDGAPGFAEDLTLSGLPAGAYSVEVLVTGRQGLKPVAAPQQVRVEAGQTLRLEFAF